MLLQSKDLRSLDVVTSKNFEQLLIHPEIVKRLRRNGFDVPTPVQAGAIPIGLLGNDLLVQAKSGTGKTLVFAILVANAIMETTTKDCIAVIIAPVREIAYQIKDTIEKIVPYNTRVGVFIGGEDVKLNKEMISYGCNVAIGTPGRMAQLVRLGLLSLKESNIFVLDEADKLMDSQYREDIELVYKALNPETTRVTAFSATYPHGLDVFLSLFMKSPVGLRLDSENVQPLSNYQYAVIALGKNPINVVVDEILSCLTFSQAVVFTNTSNVCSNVYDYFVEKDYAVKAISSNHTQEARNRAIHHLKNDSIRVLVSTDIIARGIDAPNVNIVINIGVPLDLETYLHRIGRAGRYGGNGASLTILTSQSDVIKFYRLMKAGNLNVKQLDITQSFPPNLFENLEFHNNSKELDKVSSKALYANDKYDVSSPNENYTLQKFQRSKVPLYKPDTSKDEHKMDIAGMKSATAKNGSIIKECLKEVNPSPSPSSSAYSECNNENLSSHERMNALKTKSFGKSFAGSSTNVFKSSSLFSVKTKPIVSDSNTLDAENVIDLPSTSNVHEIIDSNVVNDVPMSSQLSMNEISDDESPSSTPDTNETISEEDDDEQESSLINDMETLQIDDEMIAKSDDEQLTNQFSALMDGVRRESQLVQQQLQKQMVDSRIVKNNENDFYYNFAHRLLSKFNDSC